MTAATRRQVYACMHLVLARQVPWLPVARVAALEEWCLGSSVWVLAGDARFSCPDLEALEVRSMSASFRDALCRLLHLAWYLLRSQAGWELGGRADPPGLDFVGNTEKQQVDAFAGVWWSSGLGILVSPVSCLLSPLQKGSSP